MKNFKEFINRRLAWFRGEWGGLNLRAKLFLSSFIPASIILAAAGLLIFIIVDRGLEKNLHKEMESSVESVTLMIENSLDLSIRNHLRGVVEINRDTVAYFYSLYRKGILSEAEAKKRAGAVLLSQKIGRTGYIFVWDINGAPGKVILAVHPYIQGDNVANEQFVQDGLKIRDGYHRYKWKNPGEREEREKVMYLSFFKPWNWIIAASSYREEFTELISITDFSEKILAVRFGSMGYYFIINSRGDVVIHPYLTGNYYDSADRTGRKFVQEICAKKNGEITYYWPEPGDSEPRKKLSLYRYIPDFDWIVISSSYPDEYNATLSGIGFIIITSLVMLIVLLSAATYLSGSRIIRPLRAIMEKLREGAAGDYSISLPVISNDELGELSGHFNTFIEQIRSHRNDLVSARAYLGNIINSLPSILIAVDAGGEVKLWNRGAEAFTGIPAEKAESSNIYELLPLMENYRNSFNKTITSKSVTELRQRALSVTGEKRDLRVSVYPFSREETDIAVIRMDDITDELKKDAQLLQAQKMEIVGTLAGGLAHDFNNVLAGIIGTVSLMKFHAERGTESGLEDKYLAIIESSARRAADIVDQLLALSRKNEPSMQPFDLNRSLENVMMICRNSLDKSIEIVPEYYPGQAIVNGSASQIEQVILNLCVNAAHAMTIMRDDGDPPGGRLMTSISRVTSDHSLCSVHPAAVEGRDYQVVTISDTGVGMTAEHQDKIFDPFFTTKPKDKGSGLGLLMVYNIVKAHGGFIDLFSEPGRGTTFTVYLPAASGDTDEFKPDTADTGILEGSGSILVIDDELTVAETARGILEQCGYTVYTALDGTEGIRFFSENRSSLDLVILDMSMPKMSGKDVFIELRKIDSGVPVLLSSGFRQDQMVQETIKLGVDDFIQKPYSLYELAVKVKNVLSRGTASRNR